VTQETWLDVRGDERPTQEGIVHEIDLPGGQIVGGSEIAVELSHPIVSNLVAV
jgi:hypothetical protein